jgi:hypothetical protein
MRKLNLVEYLVLKLGIHEKEEDINEWITTNEITIDYLQIYGVEQLFDYIIEWITTNEINKDELIDILEADELYFIIKDEINLIIEEKYAADFKFYMECMNRNIDNTPYIFLLETMFENWSIEDQSRFIVELACQIRYNNISLFDIPKFLIHEREILIAATYDFWDKASEEQDFFKKCVREANYTKDWEFIDAIFKSDDGSLAAIIADESIKELPQYWLGEFKAWYEYPKECLPEPADYKSVYDLLPENFKNDLGFNKILIKEIIGFYHSLNENMKANAEIYKILNENMV